MSTIAEPSLFDWTPPPPAETAPYVRGSETSQAAARSLQERGLLGPLEQKVFDAIDAAGKHGLTCQESEAVTGLEHTTASARIRGLELKQRVVKTADKRPTRSGMKAAVYVTAARAA